MSGRFRVALATSQEWAGLHEDDWHLVEALRAAGGEATPEVWTDPAARWEDYDAVLIRSTWDYVGRVEEFRAWLARLEARGVRVFNDVATLRRNLDKTYLKDLAARGVETVPTVWIEPGAAPASVRETLAGLAWDEVVVKPSISAGAHKTVRTTRAALLRDPAPVRAIVDDGAAAAMIQPFLPEVARDGEWSFLYFGGEYSHAALKTPKAGDYRVQWRHGGTQVGRPAPDGVLTQAENVLDAAAPVGERPLYARVDGVIRDGRLLLVELELIEPYLFLGQDERAAGRLAAACMRAIRQGPG